MSQTIVLTTPQLLRDLQEIEHVIAALVKNRSRNLEDLEDLRWLQGRRRYVLALLASRRAQKNKKIVSLEAWRNGGSGLRQVLARVA